MQTKLRVGTKAPVIRTADVQGNEVHSKKLKADFLLLAFLRYAGCPFCNLSVHRLSLEHPLLKDQRCEVIAFIQSDKKEIHKNIYGRHKVLPEFPIIADKEMKYYRQFNVKPSYKNTSRFIKDIPHWVHAVREHGFKQGKINGNLFIAPSLFLIHRASGKIIYRNDVADLFAHETFSPIYDKLQLGLQEV